MRKREKQLNTYEKGLGGDGARLRCERAAEKNPLSNEPEPKERAPRGFPAKRPLANVRRGRDLVHPVLYTDDSRISHRTRLQWTPLFFTLHRDAGMWRGRRGGPPPTPSFSSRSKPPTQRRRFVNQTVACQIRGKKKNLTNHRQIRLFTFLFSSFFSSGTEEYRRSRR